MHFLALASTLLGVAGTVLAAVDPKLDPISSPGKSEVIPMGAQYTIKWASTGGVDAGDISLTLMRGTDESRLASVSNITDSVASKKGTFSWMVPNDLDAAADYSIKVTALLQHPAVYNFSPLFTIGSGKSSGGSSASGSGTTTASVATATSPNTSTMSSAASTTTSASASAASSTPTGLAAHAEPAPLALVGAIAVAMFTF